MMCVSWEVWARGEGEQVGRGEGRDGRVGRVGTARGLPVGVLWECGVGIRLSKECDMNVRNDDSDMMRGGEQCRG